MARPSLRPQWVHDEWIGRLVTAQTISGPAPLFDVDGALRKSLMDYCAGRSDG